MHVNCPCNHPYPRVIVPTYHNMLQLWRQNIHEKYYCPFPSHLQHATLLVGPLLGSTLYLLTRPQLGPQFSFAMMPSQVLYLALESSVILLQRLHHAQMMAQPSSGYHLLQKFRSRINPDQTPLFYYYQTPLPWLALRLVHH